MSKHKLINKLLIAHIEHLDGNIKSDKEQAERQHINIQNLERELRQAERAARDAYVAPTVRSKYATLEELRLLMDPREVSEKKIYAIKAVMNATGVGLRDAKNFIEGQIFTTKQYLVDAPKLEPVPTPPSDWNRIFD